MRYTFGKTGLRSASLHRVCGKNFDAAHAVSCPTDGYPALRHNEIRDVNATLQCFARLPPTYKIVEPPLQPLSANEW